MNVSFVSLLSLSLVALGLSVVNSAPVVQQTARTAAQSQANRPIPPDKRISPDKKIGTWNWDSAPKIEAFADFPGNGKKKWTIEKDDQKRKALKDEIARLRKEPSDKIKAFPAAADFPGIPANGTPLVERSIEINTSAKGWHSTGLYALPGTEVTIEIPSSVKLEITDGKKSQNYGVRIGCHTDKLNLEKHKTWSRSPELSFNTPIKSATTKITSPFGGLLYIEVPDKAEGKFTVKIKNAAAAPAFILGKTTAEQWKAQLEGTTVPWGELECPRVTVSLPLDQLKQIPDVQKIAEHLQKNMELQDWLMGWDTLPGKLNKPMRLVVDRQISAGGGHSGYPAMGTIGWGKPIATGSLITNGSWGIWHELGHNHQSAPYRLDGLGEVTVNLFSLLCQMKTSGKTIETSWGGMKSLSGDLSEFFSGTETYTEAGKKHGLRLYFFAELIKEFGFEPFRAASLKYHAQPYDAKNTPNPEKWDWLMIALSEATGKNLAPYFTAWRTPVTEAAKEKIAKLPTWLPSSDYPKNYIKQ